MYLTQTPLFEQTGWITRALVDGSWRDLPPDCIGPAYKDFVQALKTLDKIALTDPQLLKEPEFLAALRLDSGPVPEVHHNSANRNLAWSCMLYFRVFDMLLALENPDLEKNSAIPDVAPTFRFPAQADKLLKELSRWPDHVDTFREELGHQQSQEIEIIPKDVAPVFAFNATEREALKHLAWKNIQATIAGLIYVLELGSVNAPLLKGSQLSIAPSRLLSERYKSYPDNSTAANILRPLALFLIVSPALVFCNIDLSKTHTDLDVELDISNMLLAAGQKSAAVRFIESFAHALVRGSSGFSAASVSTVNVGHLAQMPAITPQDTNLFKGLRSRYKSNGTVKSLNAPRMPVSRPLELYEMPFLVAPQSAAPFSSSAETGPIVRALSHVPRAQAFPKLENMTLVADLPAQEAKSIFYRRAGEQQELESNPSSSLSNSVPPANSNVESE
ncbi:hypothetical protein R3P38DRAFT_3140103 [Favolaschia claudopus]|uniref:Uncharacterized protein n=1 Tax=Favolaschia claudopus TaxID=2862362 RepID=A0AAV9Z682_9AGAR